MRKQELFMVICLLVSPLAFLINGPRSVSAVSDTEASDYFEEYAEMTKNSDLEKILIVKSQVKPNDYGAERMIEMPNHIYYLQYKTTEDYNLAWNELKNDESIKVAPNITLSTVEGENEENVDGSREFMSWGIEAMGLDHMIEGIENSGKPLNNVLVAVIDTGVKTSVFYERFPERMLYSYCVATCEDGMDDTAGHGTHILGTIADGTTDNVELLMIRAGATGSFSLTNLLTSIEYATEQGVDVLNISAGTAFDLNNETYNAQYDMTWGEIYRQVWEMEKAVIDEAVATGTIIIAAAGNNGNGTVLYPASYDNVISVGAVNRNLEKATMSNYNEYINYVAPGVAIYSLNIAHTPDNGVDLTIFSSGTSMAAPHVAAAAAGLKSFNKNLGFDDVVAIFNSRAIDLGDTGRDDYYGNGFIDFSESDFCSSSVRCDEYGVFVDPNPPEEVDPADDENPAGEPDISDDEEIVVPNTGVTKNSDDNGASISLFSLGLIIIALPGIYRRVERTTREK